MFAAWENTLSFLTAGGTTRYGKATAIRELLDDQLTICIQI